MMDASMFWDLFMDTGSPEMFLLYRSCERKNKDEHGEVSSSWKDSAR